MELIEKTIKIIKPVDSGLMEEAQRRLDNLTKPKGSLGRLEEIAKRLAAITNQKAPSFKRKIVFTMAGDHGVAAEGVSLYPSEVTYQMVLNFLNGGAAINVLARHAGAEVIVVDMGISKEINDLRLKNKKINFGTKNIAKGPAMTKEEAIRSIEAGIEVFEEEFAKKEISMIGTGDMGIANTTPSAAIISVLSGVSPKEIAGRGTGLDDKQLETKVRVIEKTLKINRPDPKDAIDILAKVGGFEIGGICGVILGAASRSVPVVMDGFISSAGAMLACKLAPAARDYIFAAHMSQEKGHRIALKTIGLEPVLDLDMRLGEGTGAALAMGIIEAAAKILNEMATFGEAKVSTENK